MQRCRKKLPFRGLEIDARDRLLAQTDPQNPAVWTGFFIVPSPAQNPRGDGPMTDLRSSLHGLCLPLVTPFRDRELEESFMRRLARSYRIFTVNVRVLPARARENI